jgi:hypothetical protein
MFVSCPNIKYYNKKFYFVDGDETSLGVYDKSFTFRLHISEDLLTWTEKRFFVQSLHRNYCWAPELFIDDDGSAYVYFCSGDDQEENEGSTGIYRDVLDMYVSKCENIENPVFQTATALNLPVSNDDVNVSETNYTDGIVEKINNKYYMVVKNEHWLKEQNDGSFLGNNIILMKSDYPDRDFEVVPNWPLSKITSIEAPSICKVSDNDIYITVDKFAVDGSVPQPKSHYITFHTSNIETGPFSTHYCTTDTGKILRHGSATYINDYYAKSVIKKLGTLNTSSANVDLNIYKKNVDTIQPQMRAKNGFVVLAPFAPAKQTIYELKDTAVSYIIDGYSNNVTNADDVYFDYQNDAGGMLHVKSGNFWIAGGRKRLIHCLASETGLSYVGDAKDLISPLTMRYPGNTSGWTEWRSAFIITMQTNSVAEIEFDVDCPFSKNVFGASFSLRIDNVGGTDYAAFDLLRVYNTEGFPLTNTNHKIACVKTGTHTFNVLIKYDNNATPVINFKKIYTTYSTFSHLSFDPISSTDNLPAGTEITLNNLT